MRRSVLACAGISALLLSACSGNGPTNLKIHEVALSGGTQERIVWVYGSLNGRASSSVKLGDSTVTLRPQISGDPLATPGSLSVNGLATFRQPTGQTDPKVSVTRTADGLFTVSPQNGASLAAVYYTDGQSWTKLSGVSGVVSGTPANGLRGAGQMTDAEADAIAGQLRPQGPLAVAVLNDPSAGFTVEPTPSESLRTSLYILPGVNTAAGTASGTVTTTPGTPSPITGDPLNFTAIAQGTNANTTQSSVQVASTAAQAQALYALAYGRQTNPPRPPALSGQTLVGLFVGQRNSGGYGVQVRSVQGSGSALNVTVTLTSPPAGSISTMALTSPWVIVQVPGTYTSANLTVTNPQVQPGGSTR